MKKQSNESSPRARARHIAQLLTEVIECARQDVADIAEPKAQALFETTAEVLIGLRKAHYDYESGTEKAMS
jgi:hypothetical protein